MVDLAGAERPTKVADERSSSMDIAAKMFAGKELTIVE